MKWIFFVTIKIKSRAYIVIIKFYLNTGFYFISSFILRTINQFRKAFTTKTIEYEIHLKIEFWLYLLKIFWRIKERFLNSLKYKLYLNNKEGNVRKILFTFFYKLHSLKMHVNFQLYFCRLILFLSKTEQWWKAIMCLI